MKSMIKKFNFKTLLILPFIILMLFTSCQNEESEIINPTNDETITSSSSLANLMLNTAARDGSFDDILDNASCIALNLPVTVTINDITITIQTLEDLDLIEAIINEFETDEDILQFLFPITITLDNYETYVIHNEEELDVFVEECSSHEDVIECVDFVYPISFAIYDTNFQVIDTVVIENDEALHDFLENLDNPVGGAVLVSLNFPVTMQYANGDTIEVYNNQELEEAINAAEEDCSRFDCEADIISQNLQECFWYAETNLFAIFVAEELHFGQNGQVQIINTVSNQVTDTGSWFVSTIGQDIIVTLSFNQEPYTLISLDWEVVECDDDRIEMINGNNHLVFEQECETNTFDCPDLQANIGDVCETGTGVVGVINSDCECELNNNTFDCPDLQANVGDDCLDPTGMLGVVNADCECVEDDRIFDCPDLQANVGDVCLTSTGEVGIVNADCECEDDDTNFDCPDLQANIGDVCETGAGVLGVINSDCECEINNNTFDCPDLQANVGDVCLTSTGEVGFVNANCECEEDDTNFDCPDLQANIGDVCETPSGDIGIINADCGCELIDICSEQDIDAYLLECLWYIVNYNGDNNLITFEFDFNDDGTVIITSDNQVITAMWSTSQSVAGAILEFGNVNGGDIQAITGNWLVVECNSGRLEMFRDNDIMVMEQDCN